MNTLPQCLIDKLVYLACVSYLNGSTWGPVGATHTERLEGWCEALGASYERELKRVTNLINSKPTWQLYQELGKKHGWPHR